MNQHKTRWLTQREKRKALAFVLALLACVGILIGVWL